MSTPQDQARLIAERVARKVAGSSSSTGTQRRAASNPANGGPVREELSSIREGLHDLETKLERIESKLTSDSGSSGNGSASERPSARVIDFISSGPPTRSAPSVTHPPVTDQPPLESSKPSSEFFQFIPATESPWHGRLASMLGNQNPQPEFRSAGSPAGQPWGGSPQSVEHASQERFGVEEATVAELVEFFEKEKQCSIDPTGKPCDHCAMCSSRGF